MSRKTYNNMVKATRMIADKGYEWNEANQMAMNCFETSKQNGMSIEWHINKIASMEEYTCM